MLNHEICGGCGKRFSDLFPGMGPEMPDFHDSPIYCSAECAKRGIVPMFGIDWEAPKRPQLDLSGLDDRLQDFLGD